MVVGEHSRPVDLDCNPCRAKKTTNVRSVMADETIRLSPPIQRSLEELLSYMGEDEMLEVSCQWRLTGDWCLMRADDHLDL